MSKLPTLFVSHGSPMFAIEHGMTAPALTQWAAKQVKPKTILVMSPHWMARDVVVMTTPQPATWHDFGGFPSTLYQLQYPALGDPVLAQQVVDLLSAANINVVNDNQRPFDHGAWVPLMHLYPKADIPVVQLALPMDYSPQQLFSLGQALTGLREQGVLIVASGSMTHNLGEFFNSHAKPTLNAPAQSYVVAFARWIEQAILAKNYAVLFDYRVQAPRAVRAHPTDEHLRPLFFALGVANDDTPYYLSREIMYGILAMDAVAFG